MSCSLALLSLGGRTDPAAYRYWTGEGTSTEFEYLSQIAFPTSAAENVSGASTGSVALVFAFASCASSVPFILLAAKGAIEAQTSCNCYFFVLQLIP